MCYVALDFSTVFTVSGADPRPCGDEHASQHQYVSGEMKQLRAFAEKRDSENRAEHRHQVNEGCRAIGADQLHAAIEKQIGQR